MELLTFVCVCHNGPLKMFSAYIMCVIFRKKFIQIVEKKKDEEADSAYLSKSLTSFTKCEIYNIFLCLSVCMSVCAQVCI